MKNLWRNLKDTEYYKTFALSGNVCYHCIFTSGSKKFLYGLQRILQERIDLRRKKIYRSQRAFQLRLDTGDSIRIFKFLYKNTDPNIFLKRKFRIFLKYFGLRPVRIDTDVKKILEKVATW